MTLSRRSALLRGAAGLAMAATTIPLAFKAVKTKAALAGPDPVIAAYRRWRTAYENWSRTGLEAEKAERRWRRFVEPYPENQQSDEDNGSYAMRSAAPRESYYADRRPQRVTDLYDLHEAWCDKECEAFPAMMQTPATTLDGVRLKVRAIQEDSDRGQAWAEERHNTGLDFILDDLDALIDEDAPWITSLGRDLERMSG